MKRIAVLFAEGFEEIEAVAIVDVLRRAEFEVLMTGLGAMSVTGAHGIAIAMDTVLDRLDLGSLSMIVLPGGMPGSANLAGDERVLQALRQTAAAGKHVAAICAAPIALQAAGLLAGKTVTSYPAFADQLRNVTHTGAPVEVDGKLITGKGPGTAIAFALRLVAELGKPEVARQLAVGMIANS